ncbi:MAG: zinc ribbon domain-containing protein [Chitinivibrionia bacterium]|nr:zinc ribbon domain-containing protein [Chitinivibrionia bacterium]
MRKIKVAAVVVLLSVVFVLANNFCTNCGVQLLEGINFCGNCGAAVNTIATPQMIPLSPTSIYVERQELPRSDNVFVVLRRDAEIQEFQFRRERTLTIAENTHISTTGQLGLGMSIEFGLITPTDVYLSHNINLGIPHIFGYLFNVGGVVNRHGRGTHIFGGSVGFQWFGYHSWQHSFGGVFWKMMIGRKHNFDLTVRSLFGYYEEWNRYNWWNYRWGQWQQTEMLQTITGFQQTTVLSLGWTMFRSRI